MKRQPDGRFRGNRSSIKVSERTQIGLWVEGEAIRFKRMGMSFELIAGILTRAGRGEYMATVSLPEGVTFPPDYSITKMAVCKAYRRRLQREPSLQAREHRELDTERFEQMFWLLQPAIKRGEPKAIEVGVKVLAQKAKVIGYEAASKVELIGNSGAPLPITLVREVIERAEQQEQEEKNAERRLDDEKK
jgi:hypothetical protein